MEPPSYETSLQPSGNVILKNFTQPPNKIALLNDLKNWQGEDFPSFEDVIVSRITDQQEKMMAMSFALWRSDQTEQFPITVDEKVLKMLGYSRKDNFKRDLLKDFGDGDETDWILLKNEEPFRDTDGRVGQAWRAETIKITGEVFKSMAMKSNTSIGKASRSYFVSLESIMFCYMQASNEWKTAKQIQAKDIEMTEAIAAKDTEVKQAIEAKENEIELYKKQLEESRVPFSNKEAVQIVYVFTDPASEGKNLYKIGETKFNKSEKRVKEQQSGNPEKLKTVLEVKCINSRILESASHNVMKQLNWHHNGEWFQAPISRIRGILLGLAHALNTALRVENATEEEILEAICHWKPPLSCEAPVKNTIDETLEMQAVRFFRENFKYEIGAKTKSGVVIKLFIEWSKENDFKLESTASNKISPFLQKCVVMFNSGVVFNPICSFVSNGKRTQTPGFQNLRQSN
jgi:hypothetical protein